MAQDEKMDKQDASIKKMAKALREGARMLDLACPVCNNPIFQVRSGEKMCVACERRVLIEGEELKKTEENVSPLINEMAPKKEAPSKGPPVQAGKPSPSSRAIASLLMERCMEKLASLVGKMERTSDEHELSIVYENILKVLEILKQLNYL
nr:Sjogren's syndrome/scleroderma autoantigen 1 family protein [Candidatus Sigynarchaeum springense]